MRFGRGSIMRRRASQLCPRRMQPSHAILKGSAHPRSEIDARITGAKEVREVGERNSLQIVLVSLFATIILCSSMIAAVPIRAFAVTGSDLVAVARSQIGKGGATYQDYFGNTAHTNQWCHYFVSWCAKQIGVEGTLVPHTGQCNAGMQWYKNRGLWHNVSASYTPQAGDIVYFYTYGDASESHHVGIVTSASGGRVHTIEGNCRNLVKVDGGYSNGYPQDGSRVSSSSNTRILGYGSPWENSDHNPIGTLDVIRDGIGQFYVAGWAFDPDATSQSLDIHIYVGGPAGSGAEGYAIKANGYRDDVNGAYEISGNHGYDAWIATSKTGTLPIYAYAVNTGQGENGLIGTGSVTIAAEKQPPKIADVSLENLTPEGYRVTCTVTDNVGVARVAFPTWTAPGGQDDIIWGEGTRSGNTYSFEVRVADHGFSRGCYYHTHVYAYDASGNSASSGAISCVLVPSAMANLGDSTYFLVDSPNMTWANSKQTCEGAYRSGHLVTIGSADEQEAVTTLARQGALANYWIGASDSVKEGTWMWVDGIGVSDYKNWASGEPSGGVTENVAVLRKTSGKWYDYPDSAASDVGYIMEVEGLHERHGELVDDLDEGIYSINCFASPGFAVDVFDMKMTPGANVGITDDNGTNAQRYQFTKNDDETYTITNVQSGCALEVAGGSLADGANVQQYTPNGTPAQRWYIERGTDGGYFLRSKVSNLYLHVVAGRYALGTNLIAYHSVNHSAQKFMLKRAEHPTAVNTEVYDVTTKGYKVRIELFSPQGIGRVRFPTWTSAGEQDDLLWSEGSVKGNVATFEVKRSEHKGEQGRYCTHVYVTDSYGHEYWVAGMNDIIVPNAIASWQNSTYFLVDDAAESWAKAKSLCNSQNTWLSGKAHLVTITCADEQAAVAELARSGARESYCIGLSRESMSNVWTWEDGAQTNDYTHWANGSPLDGSTENYAVMESAGGSWRSVSGTANKHQGFILEVVGDDRCAPVISQTEVVELDETGYTVTCVVEDPSGVSKVEFPSWVPAKGEIGDDALWKEGGLYQDSGSSKVIAEFRVSTQDHGGATGEYATHIYATDMLGNKTPVHLVTDQKVEGIVVPNATCSVGDAIYYRFDQAVTWEQANAAVEGSAIKGLTLASIRSCEEDAAIGKLIAGAKKAAYWLGLTNKASSDGSYAWSDGSALSYVHWSSGQPNNFVSAQYGAVATSDLMWHAYANAGKDGMTANMGYIAKSDVEPTDVVPCKGNHIWGDWVVTKEPSCDKEGLRERVCSVCGSYETEPTTKLAHTPAPPVHESEHSANCTQDGAYDLVTRCAICEEELAREHVIVTALGHDWSTWRTVIPATHDSPGSEARSCFRCGEVEELSLPPLIADGAVIKVTNTHASPGETVTVAVSIEDNPGILGAVLTVSFDEALKLVDAKNGDALAMLTMTKPGGLLVSPCTFVWDGVEVDQASVRDGDVLILTFKIDENSAAGSELGVRVSGNQGAVIDGDAHPVDVTYVSGSISVVDGNEPGDVDGDGQVDSRDVIFIRRHIVGGYSQSIDVTAADVNADGQVDSLDVVLLRRYIAGGWGVKLKSSLLRALSPLGV